MHFEAEKKELHHTWAQSSFSSTNIRDAIMLRCFIQWNFIRNEIITATIRLFSPICYN